MALSPMARPDGLRVLGAALVAGHRPRDQVPLQPLRAAGPEHGGGGGRRAAGAVLGAVVAVEPVVRPIYDCVRLLNSCMCVFRGFGPLGHYVYYGVEPPLSVGRIAHYQKMF